MVLELVNLIKLAYDNKVLKLVIILSNKKRNPNLAKVIVA